MLVMYGYGNPAKQLTLDQLELRSDWALLHPEMRKRLLAMFDASGGKVGIGGGGRTSAQQESLFRSRYLIEYNPTSIWWDGHYWSKKPGVASAAPPGLSFHEESLDGKALAADLIGDLGWVGVHAVEFGLRDFSDVVSEPWHVQPVEIPTSKREYDAHPVKYPLKSWGTTMPPPAVPEDDMRIAILKPQGAYAVFLAETTQAGIALNVRWSGEGTAKVQSVIDAHVAAGADVRSVLITDLRNCFLLGPLPKGDPAYNWTADDFAGVD